MLLYSSCLKLLPDKLKSRWLGPFVITHLFPHGVVEMRSLDTNKLFKVNGHHLKLFYENMPTIDCEEFSLEDPVSNF